ncbi:MAG: hypothetical protein HUU29_07690 [Planctomycetaceae bacterium]|nr:hypothetical protein [Planctomycetaceae bacterium]
MLHAMKKPTALAGVVAALAFGGSAMAQDLVARWNDGLNFFSEDKSVDIKIGGRIHNDWEWGSGDDDLEAATGNTFQDQVIFRRARLAIAGKFMKHFGFKAQYDFAADGTADFKDVYFDINKVPLVDQVRVGQFLIPYGFEIQNSSNNNTFIERAGPVNAFTVERQTGMMLTKSFLEKKRLTFQVAVSRNTNAFGEDSGDGEYSVTGRVFGMPYSFGEGGADGIVHVGASVQSFHNGRGGVAFAARPSVRMGPSLLSTGALNGGGGNNVDDVMKWEVDAAFTYKSLCVQGEYHSVQVNSEALDDPSLTAFYVYASYFLTGEQRPYKGGVFGYTKPLTNVYGGEGEGGIGGWEVAVRYSQGDFEDGGVAGGEANDITIGLNWYWNGNFRILWNYVMADLDDVGKAQYFTMRFSLFF